jgi:hypothetical protein
MLQKKLHCFFLRRFVPEKQEKSKKTQHFISQKQKSKKIQHLG